MLGHVLDEALNAFRACRARQDRVHGNAGAFGNLRQATAERDLHAFGDAVVDHLNRDLHAGLTRNEDDAAPVAIHHVGQIQPTQAHAGVKIGVDDGLPIRIAEIVKRLDRISPNVVDEHVDFLKAGLALLHHVRITEVAREGVQLGLRKFFFDPIQGLGHAGIGTAVDDDLRPLTRESGRDGQANTCR